MDEEVEDIVRIKRRSFEDMQKEMHKIYEKFGDDSSEALLASKLVKERLKKDKEDDN
jgi:hypothetical protein